MSEITRLGFVRSSAGAAVGVSALGALAAPAADAERVEPGEHAGAKPVVAYVKDPASGEIAVMSGEHRVIIRDRALAAKLARASRG